MHRPCIFCALALISKEKQVKHLKGNSCQTGIEGRAERRMQGDVQKACGDHAERLPEDVLENMQRKRARQLIRLRLCIKLQVTCFPSAGPKRIAKESDQGDVRKYTCREMCRKHAEIIQRDCLKTCWRTCRKSGRAD